MMRLELSLPAGAFLLASIAVLFRMAGGAATTTPSPLSVACPGDDWKKNYIDQECYCDLTDVCLDYHFRQEVDDCPYCAVLPTTRDPALPPPDGGMNFFSMFAQPPPEDDGMTPEEARQKWEEENPEGGEDDPEPEEEEEEGSADGENNGSGSGTAEEELADAEAAAAAAAAAAEAEAAAELAAAEAAAEGPTTIGPDNSIVVSHPRCRQIPYGVKFTDLANGVTRRCCCDGHPGQVFRLTVDVHPYKSFRWQKNFKYVGKATTKAMIDEVNLQILTILNVVLGPGAVTSLEWERVYRHWPVSVAFDYKLTMRQVSAANLGTIYDRLYDVMEADNITSWSPEFNGFNYYDHETLYIGPYPEEDSSAAETTAMQVDPTEEPEDEMDMDVYLYAMLPAGLVVILLVFICMCVFRRVCHCYGWWH